MTKEVWKDIPEYEGVYLASNFGNIKSSRRSGSSGRVLKKRVSMNGYERVTLCVRNVKKNHSIHRLVMSAFHGDSELVVNHINGIKTDNRLENLEYCTKSENMKHAYKLELVARQLGEKANGSKLKYIEVIEIKKLLKTKELTITKIAKKFNVHYITVWDIKAGKTWKHIEV